MDYKLQEAYANIGNVDRLYNEIDKVKAAVTKAQNALLDLADGLTELVLSANSIGGKVAQITPSYLKPHIARITQMAESELQSVLENGGNSLDALKTILGNIPYRDLKPQDAQEARATIVGQPNLTILSIFCGKLRQACVLFF